MGQVVAAVPGVDTDVRAEVDRAGDRVHELAPVRIRVEPAQQHDPAGVKRVEQVERGLDRHARRVRQLGPGLLGLLILQHWLSLSRSLLLHLI